MNERLDFFSMEIADEGVTLTYRYKFKLQIS